MRMIGAALLVVGLVVFLIGCRKRAVPTSDERSQENPGAAVTLPTATNSALSHGGKTGTGPVDTNGRVDYATALNERLSKGVTPENNANCAIWKVLGPIPLSAQDKIPVDYFGQLGMRPPSATGQYYIGIRQYAEQRNGAGTGTASFDALGRLANRPWASKDDATMSSWLQANEKALAALREAVKLPRYYNPLIPKQGEKGSKGLINSLLPSLQPCREMAAALACRAMLNLEQNRPDEAWQDLLACHRLGRQVGRGGCLIEGLVGMAIEQIACRGDIAYLDSTRLDARAVEKCLQDLAALPSVASAADKLDLGERYCFLDIVTLASRHGLRYLKSLGDEQDTPNEFADWALDDVDWAPAFENANKWFDRFTSCAREPIRAARVQKFTEFRSDLLALKTKATDLDRVSHMLRDKNYSAKAKGEVIGNILISLMLPAADKVVDAEDRARQAFDTVAVAFSVAWYQRINGRYPDSLAKLAPTYLTQVPRDVFSGKELIYRPNATGFLLYSVGVNGVDEGGRWADDRPPGDDIAVRIPQPPKP